ncbi:(S)-coclaurine N-methyltransferase [Biomphalaria glabrata]|uniref:Methyltransferase domain-containing protein n=1 Tax=Biomphalaria glabrata TaxID=6526 RepID=A0A2C9JC48_BIOGL|nr:(S)-coclaurine N-methyltransferase [Biomphalaria glabrata]
MASDDETLRKGVRQSLESWVRKLECNGDIEKQHFFKKKFVNSLGAAPIATHTELANEQHYEVPTEFFLEVLGKRLKYSGCVWPEGVSTLDEAEDATLALYCERAQLQDGYAVMDLGCGWGSLTLYILEKFPNCKVTCVSNSSTQRASIQERAEKLGYAARLQAITADANTFTTNEQFDRIISIEMFEHMKNYKALFHKVSSWMKPNGLLFVQIFCHKHNPYAFDIKPGSDTEWMAKNFFTGGTMPSSDLFLFFQNDINLVDWWVVNGTHYTKTLDAWLAKMDASKAKVEELFAKHYGNDAAQQTFNWRLFFIFCSEVFQYKNGNEWHILHQLFTKKLASAL